MKSVELTVTKINVYDEVSKTSSYTGAKMTEDEKAYDRIFATDDDRLMLERFWVESCNAATQLFKPFITSVNEQPESHGVVLDRNYVITLSMPENFDISLTDSMQTSLYSFFVNNIVGKWYKFTDKKESESYTAEAEDMLKDVKIKLYYRKKPTRIIPT